MSRNGAQRRRTAALRERNFGIHADRVRFGACVCAAAGVCEGRNVAAHGPKSRGAGGCWADLVCMCWHHNQEQAQIGTETFARKYGLDLRARADAQALDQPEGLGIRGLAARWALVAEALATNAKMTDDIVDAQLQDFESDALLGWVRRRMDTLDTSGSIDTKLLWTEDIGLILDMDDDRLSHAEYLDRAWGLCAVAGGWT